MFVFRWGVDGDTATAGGRNKYIPECYKCAPCAMCNVDKNGNSPSGISFGSIGNNCPEWCKQSQETLDQSGCESHFDCSPESELYLQDSGPYRFCGTHNRCASCGGDAYGCSEKWRGYNAIDGECPEHCLHGPPAWAGGGEEEGWDDEEEEEDREDGEDADGGRQCESHSDCTATAAPLVRYRRVDPFPTQVRRMAHCLHPQNCHACITPHTTRHNKLQHGTLTLLWSLLPPLSLRTIVVPVPPR